MYHFNQYDTVALVGKANRQSVHIPSDTDAVTGIDFADQFGFRPTGSTDAALITMLHTISTMLDTQPFVRVFAIDFSKAFDTVGTQSSWRWPV